MEEEEVEEEVSHSPTEINRNEDTFRHNYISTIVDSGAIRRIEQKYRCHAPSNPPNPRPAPSLLH